MPSSSPSPGELELHVGRRRGVVGELLGLVVAEAEPSLWDSVTSVPVKPLSAPVLEPFGVVCWRNEELHLHLLELACPKDEVAGRDLVSKAPAELRDAERRS